MRSRASSLNWHYSLLSLRSSSSFLRLLPRLLVTSICPFIFPSITCCRRQFLRKMWPIQLVFCFLILCTIFLCSLTLSICTQLVTVMGRFETPVTLPLVETDPGVQWIGDWLGPRDILGNFKKEINFVTLLGIEINFLEHPFHSLVTIPTEPFVTWRYANQLLNRVPDFVSVHFGRSKTDCTRKYLCTSNYKFFNNVSK